VSFRTFLALEGPASANGRGIERIEGWLVTENEKRGAQKEARGEKEDMDLSAGGASGSAGGGAPGKVAENGKAAAEEKHGLSSDLQGHIGRQLRAAFDEVAREPIPDRFLQLLKDLEESGSKK